MQTLRFIVGVIIFFAALVSGMIGIIVAFVDAGPGVPVASLTIGIAGCAIAIVMTGVFCGRHLG